ncbi:zinc-ribbon domain-containing protein [Streptomyces sp. ISL-86]|uniref:zinc-ribbon domain-containing protein n=1 Tax=Streptomyces sp. ISL-86 TaxID=2819187 RepID=UPI0035A9879D
MRRGATPTSHILGPPRRTRRRRCQGLNRATYVPRVIGRRISAAGGAVAPGPERVLDPDRVGAGGGRAWWRCPAGHEWEETVISRRSRECMSSSPALSCGSSPLPTSTASAPSPTNEARWPL